MHNSNHVMQKFGQRKRHTPAVCLLAGIGFLAGGAIAQDQNPATLDETVIDAEDQAALSIFQLEPITSADLEEVNPADLDETFRKTPAVLVNGGRAQAQQIFVNNLESTLSNVTVDGASQGNLYHHQSSVLIEPELLKSVEVYPGAGSALNGPGALNGAIRFETKNAFDLLDVHPVTTGTGKNVVTTMEQERFGGSVKSTYFSNGEGWKGAGTVYGKLNDNWALLLSGSYTDRTSYEDGNGNLVENTDYTRESALAKLSGRWDNGQSLDLSYEYFNDETLAYDRVNINTAFLLSTGRPLGLLQRLSATRHTASLSYDFNPDTSELIDLETNVFYTVQDLKRHESGETSEVGTFGLDVRNTSRFSGAQSS